MCYIVIYITCNANSQMYALEKRDFTEGKSNTITSLKQHIPGNMIL